MFIALCIGGGLLYLFIIMFGSILTNRYVGEHDAEQMSPVQYVIWLIFPISVPILGSLFLGAFFGDLIFTVFKKRKDKKEKSHKDLMKELSNAKSQIKKLEKELMEFSNY